MQTRTVRAIVVVIALVLSLAGGFVLARTQLLPDARPNVHEVSPSLDAPSLDDTSASIDSSETSHSRIDEGTPEEYSPHPEHVSEAYIPASLDVLDIPVYTGEPVSIMGEGIPQFVDADMTTSAYELYSALDELGRAGVAMACLGPETLPFAERGRISSVEPSGWSSRTYPFIDGEYLFNRCHLIAYALAGENANAHNLVTGTRYLNRDGMLPYENRIVSYIHATSNHVIYRVSPVFIDSELVCRGVRLEALSVEDHGTGICIDVFCHNVQPGVEIDYSTGASFPVDPMSIEGYTEQRAFVLNTASMKAHDPTCPAVDDMGTRHRSDVVASPQEVALWGYEPCGQCRPW